MHLKGWKFVLFARKQKFYFQSIMITGCFKEIRDCLQNRQNKKQKTVITNIHIILLGLQAISHLLSHLTTVSCFFYPFHPYCVPGNPAGSWVNSEEGIPCLSLSSQSLYVSKLREISEAYLTIPTLQINYPRLKEFKQISMEKEVSLA